MNGLAPIALEPNAINGMTDPTAFVRLDEIVRLLATNDRARLVMQGRSMEPLLCEGMVLELGPYRRDPKWGEVVVFRYGPRLVAHRVVRRRAEGPITSGDAQPWATERVAHEEVVGRLVAVYASAMSGAARIDDRAFHRLGLLAAATRWVRALPERIAQTAHQLGHALFPARRMRLQPALLAALGAIVQRDPERLASAATSVPPQPFAARAARHRCAGMLADALREFDDPLLAEVRAALAPEARSGGLGALSIRSQIGELVTILNADGIPFVLLKGAARMYGGDPDAAAHPSGDIDVLLPRYALDPAVAALRRRGYTYRAPRARQFDYRRRHHHAAPLYRSDGAGVLVELHVALAPAASLSLPTEWDALEKHFVDVAGPEGPAKVFDPFATALHLAIHQRDLRLMRDVALGARALRKLSADEFAELRRLAESETIDRIRLMASFALASRVAGLEWPLEPAEAAYLAWVERRNDMPVILARRAYGADAWLAAGGTRRLARHVLFENDPTPLQLAGRILVAPFALAYAAAMRAG